MTYRGKGKGKDFPVHAKKEYQDSRSIAPFINLGARRNSMVNITIRPLYLRKEHRHPLNRGLRGHHSLSERHGEEKNL
jgi:hypothetical protein